MNKEKLEQVTEDILRIVRGIRPNKVSSIVLQSILEDQHEDTDVRLGILRLFSLRVLRPANNWKLEEVIND